MAGIGSLTCLYAFILLFQLSYVPEYENNKCYVSVCQSEGKFSDTFSVPDCPFLLSNTGLGNSVRQFGLGPEPEDLNRPSQICSSEDLSSVEETRFARGSRGLKSLWSDPALSSIGGIRHFFHLTWEHFWAYITTLFASSPEQRQPNPNQSKHDNWNILPIIATTEVVLLIGIVWISRRMVQSSLLFIEEESNQLSQRLLLEEKLSCKLAGQNRILEFELQFCESKRSHQESQIKYVLEQFETINRKCQDRANALRRKRARAMWGKIDLKGSKQRMKEKPKKKRVCASEETLSIEIQDMEDICKLLGEVRTTLDEIHGEGLLFSPGSFEQDPPFMAETQGTQTSSPDCDEEEKTNIRELEREATLHLEKLQDEEKNEPLLEGHVEMLDQGRDGAIPKESPLQQEGDGGSQESPLEHMTIQQELPSVSVLHQENHHPQQKLNQEEVEQQMNRSKCQDVLRMLRLKMKKVKAPRSILIQYAERREKNTFPMKQVHWLDEVSAPRKHQSNDVPS